VGLAIAAMIPLIVDEVTDFINELPALILRAETWASTEFGVELPAEWRDYLASGELGALLKSAAMPSFDLAHAVVGGLMSLLGFLAEMLLVPLFAFYFSVSWDRMLARIRRFIPARHRHQVGDIASEIDRVVSSWIRGAFTVSAILAVLYATSFRIIGLHLAIPMGLIVGFLTIVPFLGTLVGAALTAVVILIDYHGPRQLIATGGVFVVLHLLEAGVLTPKIVGHKVGLGEVGALFAVVAGGKLLGLAGVILAVPLAASVMVLVRRVIQHYEKSGFYTDGALAAYVADADQVVEQEGERAGRKAVRDQAERREADAAEEAAHRAAEAWSGRDDEPPEGGTGA
ncbi:MAG TPA: AI-2E family transporter, partial [Kofleriaceae bacterium]|nr:AI-2E family transporter [Kofleriaceae bacterium]